MESLCEGIRDLLVKSNPTNQKIVCDPRLGQKVWCCKHAFSRGSDCTLAYCDSCKKIKAGLEEEEERGRRGRRSRTGTGGDDRVGTVM